MASGAEKRMAPALPVFAWVDLCLETSMHLESSLSVGLNGDRECDSVQDPVMENSGPGRHIRRR